MLVEAIAFNRAATKHTYIRSEFCELLRCLLHACMQLWSMWLVVWTLQLKRTHACMVIS